MSASRPELKEWGYLSIYDDATGIRAITLSITHGASCRLQPDGTTDLRTGVGGERGGTIGCWLGPVPFHKLRALIDEAERVGRHFWGDEWGREK